MKSHAWIVAVLLQATILPAQVNATTEKHVSPRTILRIQPHLHQGLAQVDGDFNATLIDSGYTYYDDLRGTSVNWVTLEEVKAKLESGQYRLLEWGGHGSVGGLLNVEWYARSVRKFEHTMTAPVTTPLLYSPND